MSNRSGNSSNQIGCFGKTIAILVTVGTFLSAISFVLRGTLDFSEVVPRIIKPSPTVSNTLYPDIAKTPIPSSPNTGNIPNVEWGNVTEYFNIITTDNKPQPIGLTAKQFEFIFVIEAKRDMKNVEIKYKLYDLIGVQSGYERIVTLEPYGINTDWRTNLRARGKIITPSADCSKIELSIYDGS